jgi:hypothetical protein
MWSRLVTSIGSWKEFLICTQTVIAVQSIRKPRLGPVIMGNAYDITQAEPLAALVEPEALLGDKGYEPTASSPALRCAPSRLSSRWRSNSRFLNTNEISLRPMADLLFHKPKKVNCAKLLPDDIVVKLMRCRCIDCFAVWTGGETVFRQFGRPSEAVGPYPCEFHEVFWWLHQGGYPWPESWRRTM